MASQLSVRVELYLHADQTTYELSSINEHHCTLSENGRVKERCVRIETVIDGKSKFHDETIEKQVGRMVYFNPSNP